jgi:transposase
MRKFLTNEERYLLKKQHKKERDKRICDRIKAVLLYDKGWTLMQIAEALLISDDAVRIHIKDYKVSKKLKPENGGSKEKLSKNQSKKLIEHLKKHTYLYVKDIVAYVESTYKVLYSISGMCYWLKKNGFSYKKPSIVPGKANKEIQEIWISEYFKLKQNLKEDETICFMDGVHPTHNVQLSYGWIKKGFRKEIPSNTGRQRINISGAVDIIERKLHFQEDHMLNAEATISFLEKIEKSYPQKNKIYLFSDNARYYKNKAVQGYLKNSKIALHHLPPYSPNLNPIERLWKWMKERVLYNTYYQQFDDFKLAVFGFLETISKSPPSSALGETFSRKVMDRFRAIGSPITDS